MSQVDHKNTTTEEPQECYHIGAKCQCMDCLRIWDKRPDFKSDWPNQDRG